MSSDTNDGMAQTSFFSNLKNKIVYKANKAVYEPDANNYAKNKNKDVKEEKKEKKEEEEKEDDTTDPNKLNIRRIIKNTGKKFSSTISSLFPFFLALMMSMVVTNELIIYSVPIRIILFIVVFGICLFVPIYSIILIVIYALKAMYRLYYNTTVKEEDKQPLLPPIFALLPIKLTQPETKLGRFFMYPFTYPKSEIGAEKLPKIMTKYEKELQSSFKEFDKYKTMPIFSKLIMKIHQYLENLHYIPQLPSQNEKQIDQE